MRKQEISGVSDALNNNLHAKWLLHVPVAVIQGFAGWERHA